MKQLHVSFQCTRWENLSNISYQVFKAAPVWRTTQHCSSAPVMKLYKVLLLCIGAGGLVVPDYNLHGLTSLSVSLSSRDAPAPP